MSQKKNKYFAYGKIEYPTKLYSSILKREKCAGNIVTPLGNPTGRVIEKLKPGTLVYLEKIFQNDTERRHTLKIDTNDGKSGYLYVDEASVIEYFGDKGAFIEIEISIGSGHEGNVGLMDKMIGKFSKFIKKFPNSKFAPEALLSIIDLNLFAVDMSRSISSNKSNKDQLKAAHNKRLKVVQDSLKNLISASKDENCKNLAESLHDISVRHGKSLIKSNSDKSLMDKEINREFSYKIDRFKKISGCISNPFDSPKYE